MNIIPPIRETDSQGSGYFGAPRGSRTHNGVDVACYNGSGIFPVIEGEVTKIGYPYNPNNEKKGHLRYIQVTDVTGRDWRYFYVLPSAKVGDYVTITDIIGIAQGLSDIYPDITDHIHVEIKIDGEFIDPTEYVFS